MFSNVGGLGLVFRILIVVRFVLYIKNNPKSGYFYTNYD